MKKRVIIVLILALIIVLALLLIQNIKFCNHELPEQGYLTGEYIGVEGGHFHAKTTSGHFHIKTADGKLYAFSLAAGVSLLDIEHGDFIELKYTSEHLPDGQIIHHAIEVKKIIQYA